MMKILNPERVDRLPCDFIPTGKWFIDNVFGTMMIEVRTMEVTTMPMYETREVSSWFGFSTKNKEVFVGANKVLCPSRHSMWVGEDAFVEVYDCAEKEKE